MKAFSHVEKIIKPRKLSDIDETAVGKLITALRVGRKPRTVELYCACLRSALNWAVDVKLLREAPKFRFPWKLSEQRVMSGRPITGEEHDRMLAAVKKCVKAPYVAQWQRFLLGLWPSGFRLNEAVALSWDPDADVYAFIGAKGRPMVHFRAAGQKARRDEIWPCPPEFAEMLLAVPETERTGFVLKLVGPHNSKRLMRHKEIQTTMRYYVDAEAGDIADELYRAAQSVGAKVGATETKEAVSSGD